MAEDLGQVREFIESKLLEAEAQNLLSKTEVQSMVSRLTQVTQASRDSSVQIGGNAEKVVFATGDHNRIVFNAGTTPEEVVNQLGQFLRKAENKLEEEMRRRPVRCGARSVIIMGVGTALFIGAVRFLAGLQPLELWALDRLMAAQKPKEDNRILVIAPTDEEVKRQGPAVDEQWISFTDDKLAEVLGKIQKYHPVVIGLDLQRPFKAKGKLAQLLNSNSPESLNLIGGCKTFETREGDDGRPETIKGTETAPPPEILKDRIGFVDFIIGAGEQRILRHQILAQELPPNADTCKPISSFSTLIANQFLRKEHGYNKLNSDPKNGQCPQFLHPNSSRNFTFPYFNAVTGGFKGGTEENRYGGCQILLNYGIKKIQTVNLTKLLDENELEQLDPKPKIILIGSAVRSRDFWFTPLGPIPMEGAKIQALTISQIIDTVLGNQRLIWALPELADFFWYLGWALLGSILGWRLLAWKPWVLSLTIITGVLCLVCSLSFWIWQLWLPLIPPLITLLASASGVGYLNLQLKLGSNNPLEILRKILYDVLSEGE